ncbi:hypothetical protein NMY22_g1232 [Coprinellus aureogranulatus]|nr:hypothetical protein NMY22_g1232 [Coprinellus aureogranulatus]
MNGVEVTAEPEGFGARRIWQGQTGDAITKRLCSRTTTTTTVKKMGKLNIAHHKSYHPYRRDNIERVRRDEEEAKLKEQVEEGRMLLADAEARIDLLRAKAGVSAPTSKKEKNKQLREDERELDRQLQTGTSKTMIQALAQLPTTNGHINFFEDLEQSSMAAAIKSTTVKAKAAVGAAENEKGVPLAPSEKDLKPWYSEKGKGEAGTIEELPEDKRRRDERRKSTHDPLTSITKQLASRSPTSSSYPSSSRSHSSQQLPRIGSTSASTSKDPTQARLSRESSERARALALIEKKKREKARAMAGGETPSTVYVHIGRETEDGTEDMYREEAGGLGIEIAGVRAGGTGIVMEVESGIMNGEEERDRLPGGVMPMELGKPLLVHQYVSWCLLRSKDLENTMYTIASPSRRPREVDSLWKFTLSTGTGIELGDGARHESTRVVLSRLSRC